MHPTPSQRPPPRPAGTTIDWGENTFLIETSGWPWVDLQTSLAATDVILSTIQPITPLPPWAEEAARAPLRATDTGFKRIFEYLLKLPHTRADRAVWG